MSEQEQSHNQKQYTNAEYETFLFCLKRHAKVSNLSKRRRLIAGSPDYCLRSNRITTRKYNLVTFFPIVLVSFFSKRINILCFLIGFMQCISSISITEGIPITFFELITLLIMYALKELLVDNKQRISDQRKNNQPVILLENEAKEKSTTSQHLYPGHIIKILKNEEVQADVVLLKTSNKDNSCYVEVDTDDNQKREVVHQLQKHSLKQIFNSLEINFPPPSSNYFYQFRAELSYENKPNKVNISEKNILRKGEKMLNNDFIYGLVHYTGLESNIPIQKVNKPSHFYSEINQATFLLALFSFGLSILHSGAFLYFYSNDTSISAFFSTLLQSVLIFTNLIPFSLIVSLEIAQIFQEWKLFKVLPSIKINSPDLNQNLRDIRHVVTSKMGTLTMNHMEFKHLWVNGVSYGQSLQSQLQSNKLYSNHKFEDEKFSELLKNKSEAECKAIKCISLCHNTEVDIEGQTINYFCQIQDELALMNFAKGNGFVFKGQKEIEGKQYYVLDEQGITCHYELLNFFNFTSQRKRVSIILKNPEGGIELWCKGAEQIINERLSQSSREKNPYLDQSAEYSIQGLRVLSLASKDIQQDEYEKWNEKYQLCETSQLESYQKDQNQENLIDELERDLNLIGLTAIWDQFQDELIETIKSIKDSGIKLWMVLGEKSESALVCGQQIGAISENDTIYQIEGSNESEIQSSLSNIQTLISVNGKVEGSICNPQQQQNYVIIVEGQRFSIIQQNANFSKQFVDIGSRASLIIGSRMSPRQKEQVVSLIKLHVPKQHKVLAIGSKANDASMIQQAHIGVSVKSNEKPPHLSQVSDYEVEQFKQLKHLLLDFGTKSSQMNILLTQIHFYKCGVSVVIQWWLDWLIYQMNKAQMFNYSYHVTSVLLMNILLPLIFFYAFTIEKPSSEIRSQEGRQRVLICNKLSLISHGVNGFCQGILIIVSFYLSYHLVSFSFEQMNLIICIIVFVILEIVFLIDLQRISLHKNYVTLAMVSVIYIFYAACQNSTLSVSAQILNQNLILALVFIPILLFMKIILKFILSKKE